MSSYCFWAGKRRQAATRSGQGIDAQDREDTEDRENTEDSEDTEDAEDTENEEDTENQLAEGKDVESSQEEAAEGNTDHDDIVVVNIE